MDPKLVKAKQAEKDAMEELIKTLDELN